MADPADFAQGFEELERQLAINQITNAPIQESPEMCDCGRPIPEPRRALLPGVQNCVICQEGIERARRA